MSTLSGGVAQGTVSGDLTTRSSAGCGNTGSFRLVRPVGFGGREAAMCPKRKFQIHGDGQYRSGCRLTRGVTLLVTNDAAAVLRLGWARRV